MSEGFWKRMNDRVGMLPIGAIFGLVAYIASIEIKDLDLWLHLAVGKYITVNKVVPSVDFLSGTIAGTPWVNHEWLFQVILYNIYNTLGPNGLIQMQVVVVFLTMMLLLFLGYSKDKQLTITYLLFVVFLVFQQRFTIRPDIYSLLFFTIYIFVMALHIDKRWAAGVLFVVQILWSNMHGYFFFGPLFVMIGLFSEWIKRHVKLPMEWNQAGRLTDEEYKRLKWILFWVLLACLVNPGFIKGALYPLGVFFSLSGENKIFFDFIVELQKPITSENIFSFSSYPYYKLLIILSGVTFVFNRRRIDISALLFWLVFLIFSMKAARNTAYFAFAAYLVCVTNLVNISYGDIMPIKFTDKKYQYLTLVVIKLMFLFWLFNYCQLVATRAYYDFDKYDLKSEFGGVALRSFPDKAVDFLIENEVKGNFFNDFNSGAYLVGRVFPDIKVFIDGRTEVYGGQFFKNYQKIWERGEPEAFEEAVKKYNLTGAFLNSVRQHIPQPILKHLYDHEEWKVVYFDFDAVIFLRDVPENKSLIEELEVDLTKITPLQYDLYEMGVIDVKPYRSYYRAFTLHDLELYDQALAELDVALKVRPYHVESFKLKGKIYGLQKEYEKAFENFRFAAMLSPTTRRIRDNLALAYFDTGHFEGAIKEYEKILHNWPEDIKAYFFISMCQAKLERYEESYKTLLEAHQLKPENVVDILAIGDIIYEQKEYALAERTYLLALKTGQKLAKVYQRLGQTYLKLGEQERAQAMFDKALEEEPEDEALKEEILKLQASTNESQ